MLASFYNPEEPGAETLAVYVGAAPELPELQRAVATTADLGSPEVRKAGVYVEGGLVVPGVVLTPDALGTCTHAACRLTACPW